jgi:hypothetical protein
VIGWIRGVNKTEDFSAPPIEEKVDESKDDDDKEADVQKYVDDEDKNERKDEDVEEAKKEKVNDGEEKDVENDEVEGNERAERLVKTIAAIQLTLRYQLAEDDCAVLLMRFGKEEIYKAWDTVQKPNRYQYTKVVKTSVPPFHYTKYDLRLSKTTVKKIKEFIDGDPAGVFEFLASPSDKFRSQLESLSIHFIKLCVRPTTVEKEKYLRKRIQFMGAQQQTKTETNDFPSIRIKEEMDWQ